MSKKDTKKTRKKRKTITKKDNTEKLERQKAYEFYLKEILTNEQKN